MEAPTLVEVDDLSPAGSLETGSPSVYSDMGSPSTDGSPVEAAPAEKPVLLRASQDVPYVGLGAYAKRAAEAAAQKAAAAPGEAAARLRAEADAARAAADAAAAKASADAQEAARLRREELEREATARVDDVKARVAAVQDAVATAPDRVRDATTTAGRAAATLLRGAAANVAAVGAEDAAAEARAATVDMPAPPPTAGEWRAACDAAVVSHYDFGVRATAAARRAQFTAQEPEDIFEGLAEDDMGARFSAVVVQASKKFAAEFPPLAQRTVATTLRVPRRPLVCCTKRRRASFRGGPGPTAPRLF